MFFNDGYNYFFISDVLGSKYYLKYNNVAQRAIEKFDKLPILQQWVHYCHIFSSGKYSVYIDGKIQATSSIASKGKRQTLRLNGSLIIGQEQDLYNGGFSPSEILKGFVTQVNIWNSTLEKSEILNISECLSESIGDIFSTDTSEIELINAGIEEVSLSEICRKDKDIVLFSESRMFFDSVDMCTVIGSSVYVPETEEENDEFLHSIKNLNLCSNSNYVWIGITDIEEEGVWRKVSDNHIVNNTFFSQSVLDASREENCAILKIIKGMWGDYSCNSTSTMGCVACEKNINAILYLRGICANRFTKTMVELLKYFNSKPYFHSYYGYMIYKQDEKTWSFYDTVSNLTLAEITLPSNDDYPIGKHEWTLKDTLCGKRANTYINMSLSKCTQDQYMCNNGQCVSLEMRCDDKDDCKDRSDEDQCRLVVVSDGYRNFKPPRNNDDSMLPLHPNVVVEIIRFLHIGDVNEEFQLEFLVQIKWTDARVKYLNVRKSYNANKLSEKEKSLIWKPSLGFPNVKNGKITYGNQSIFVRAIGEVEKPDYNAVDMGMYEFKI